MRVFLTTVSVGICMFVSGLFMGQATNDHTYFLIAGEEAQARQLIAEYRTNPDAFSQFPDSFQNGVNLLEQYYDLNN